MSRSKPRTAWQHRQGPLLARVGKGLIRWHSSSTHCTSAMPILDNLRARGLSVSRSLLRAGDDSSEGTSTVGAWNRGVLAAMKG